MSRLQNIDQNGANAVQRLRRQKLSGGFAFMVYSKDLPTNQCYLEYPDGLIRIVTTSKNNRDIAVVRDLSASEISNIRAKYNLY